MYARSIAIAPLKMPSASSTAVAAAAAKAAPGLDIRHDESLGELIYKLQAYFVDIIDTPFTFDQLRTTTFSTRLRPLITALSQNCHHPAIVAALLCCKAIFANEDDDRGLNESRGYAAEIVAWRFCAHLNQFTEVIDYLCYEIPNDTKSLSSDSRRPSAVNESSPLLEDSSGFFPRDLDGTPAKHTFAGLSTLELAVVCDAKKFLSQRTVQNVVNGIWDGSIVFWQDLRTDSQKRASLYNPKKTDPYCRLRVPRYQRVFEACFNVMFLALYYGVLVERNMEKVSVIEWCLNVMFLSFCYEEVSQITDAGTLFYAADFWSWADILIIIIYTVFFIFRMVGLAKHDADLINTSFDVLSLEALLLLPRIFSLFSLTPFFGTLVPALRQMTKDFIKFLALVVILYLGFLTTFTLLARDTFSLGDMTWLLIKVFFGSSYVGFDMMKKISPVLGAPLMLIFVTMTNILLITSLISLLSNSLSVVMSNAREEYLFMFSTFVLESATSSSRLTYFQPPLNLLSLAVRPLRLILPAPHLRALRIKLLKATHFPLVAIIVMYERMRGMEGESLRDKVFTIGGQKSFRSSLKAAVDKRDLRSQVGALMERSGSAGKHDDGHNHHVGGSDNGGKWNSGRAERNRPPPTPGTGPLETGFVWPKDSGRKREVEDEGDGIGDGIGDGLGDGLEENVDDGVVTVRDLTAQIEGLREELGRKIEEVAELVRRGGRG
ncbi:hypothetical protein TWF970_008995 [Orbilia oligospora]|uniref:Calcium channel YVC1-like C-terminal transmembrane domain-containing protein n=1 Tax=Orbilia oligospora TaxID=2813651 RepID=A0A7C8R3S5_ORBOL|nr:hypothetical protein TWF970_008995 [Orbilia oligospora]